MVCCADEPQNRHEPGHGCEPVEKIILWAKHDRRAKNDGVGCQFVDCGLAFGLAAGVSGTRVYTCADRRYVNETHNAGFFNRFGYRARSLRLNIGKCLIVTFDQDADEIDAASAPFSAAAIECGSRKFA